MHTLIIIAQLSDSTRHHETISNCTISQAGSNGSSGAHPSKRGEAELVLNGKESETEINIVAPHASAAATAD
jgi:hypothetical protein